MSTNEHRTNTPRAQSSREWTGFDRVYFRTLNGILKILEMILDLIAFICACVWLGSTCKKVKAGADYVEFATFHAFISTVILYFFNVFRIIHKFPVPLRIIELIYHCVCSLRLLIAGTLATVQAVNFAGVTCIPNVGTIGATACFTSAAFAVYCVDTFLLFRAWLSSGKTAGEIDMVSATKATSRTTYATRKTRLT